MSEFAMYSGPGGRHAVAIAACLLCTATLAQPAWETITLPPGVTGKAEAEVFVGDVPADPPNQRFTFEIHREWVRAEQYLPDLDSGWTLFDFTLDTAGESVAYNIQSRRGSRMSRLSIYGNSRVDSQLSPICWIRMLRIRAEAGAAVQVETQGDLTVYSSEQAEGQGGFRVFVDASGRVVRAETLSPTTHKLVRTYQYEDWVSLGAAGEHPRTITSVDFFPSEPEPFRWVVRLVEVAPLGATAVPAKYTLPKDAMITDYIDGVVRNGDGDVVGDIPDPSTADTSSPPRPRFSSVWLAAGGAVMLVAAAVIWEVRRRRG